MISETYLESDKLDIGFRGNLHVSELADRNHLKYNKAFPTEVVLVLFVQLKAHTKKPQIPKHSTTSKHCD